jgi:hypothetical protein
MPDQSRRREDRSDNGNNIDDNRTEDQAEDAVESTASSFSAPDLRRSSHPAELPIRGEQYPRLDRSRARRKLRMFLPLTRYFTQT